MSNLIRWDPFREMYTLNKVMDRMLDNFGAQGSLMGWDDQQAWSLALDMTENPGEFVVKASLPGVKAEDLEITCTNNVLTIKAETKAETEQKDHTYHLRERRYGVFSRSVALPETVVSDKIQAEYENGVLTLHLPKAEELKPRRITVQSNGKMIEAKPKK